LIPAILEFDYISFLDATNRDAFGKLNWAFADELLVGAILICYGVEMVTLISLVWSTLNTRIKIYN
jgi:hypothetical protein